MYTFFSKYRIQQTVAGMLLLVYTILISAVPLEAYAVVDVGSDKNVVNNAAFQAQSSASVASLNAATQAGANSLGIPNMKGGSATAPFSMNPNAPAITLGSGVVSCLIGAGLMLTSSLTSSAAAGFGIGTTLTNFGNAVAAWFQDLFQGKTVSVDTSNERNTRAAAAEAGGQTGQATSQGANTIASNTSLGALLAARQESTLNCIARTIARAILQQIAISTINWINSGFNGNSSFIPSYDDFFQNVADSAFGTFIQGSDFAFLCSPFQMQIRIAIAKTYAGYSRTPSCTIDQVTKNLQGFMNRFNQGGWPAFISFTTTPTNNPFGGYMYMQASMSGKLAGAAGKKSMDLSLGQGFLSTTQEQNCHLYNANTDQGLADLTQRSNSGKNLSTSAVTTNGVTYQQVCDEVNVTPGRAIGDSLSNATKTGQDELINAKYFDEIISALVTQLMTNMLQGGLGNMSGGGGYGANSYGNASYAQLRSSVSGAIPMYIQNAQQIMAAEQQNIDVASSSAAMLNQQESCWNAIVTSCQAGATTTTTTLPNGAIVQKTTGYSPADCATATQNASSTMQSPLAQGILQLQGIINQASSTIDNLQMFQAQLDATPDTDPTTLGQLIETFSQNVANGVYPDASAVNNALEAQTVIQSQLAQMQQDNVSSTTACTTIQPQTISSTTTAP